MKEKLLYGSWGCLYIFCVGLGFVREPAGFGKVMLILTSLIFFLPGAYLLWEGLRTGNRKRIRTIRILSLTSLGLTLLLLILNFLSVNWSAAVGSAFYEILVLVSAPMVCSQYWALSLFLWACMLMASFKKPATKR